MWRKFLFKKEGFKWDFKPNRFFTTLFLSVLLAGIITKWFIFLNIETGDIGVLAIPILGLIANLMKDCFIRSEVVNVDNTEEQS